METLFYLGERWKVLKCPQNSRRVGENPVHLIESTNPDAPWSVRLGPDGHLTIHGLQVAPNVRPFQTHKFLTLEGEELEIEPVPAQKTQR
jgi:hypothetical protein